MFKILLAEKTDAIIDLARSTILKNCVNVHVEIAGSKKQLKKKLIASCPDLIVVSENLDLSCKKFTKWLNHYPEFNKREYTRRKTENFERLIPADHINSTFSLSGIAFWVIQATKQHEKRQAKRFKANDKVCLYSDDSRLEGRLVNIADGGALCLYPRDSNCPPIAEKISLDIKATKNSTISEIQCFPVRIQAVKPELGCSTIYVAVKFTDLTEIQTTKLNAYIQFQKKFYKRKTGTDSKGKNGENK